MRLVFLKRRRSSSHGTFGDIILDAGKGLTQEFKTGELPWHQNRNGISCVPCGVYECRVTFSHRFQKDTYELFGVPNREDIRIHSLNYVGDRNAPNLLSESEGCIGLGKSISTSGTQRCLLRSRDAVKDFMHLLNNEPFQLDISAEKISLR